ncbi:MAG: transcription-repair coupling factor [Clostridiales bacterium]|nr:transcription-repair coupling factor [Clostridiales bacterium]
MKTFTEPLKELKEFNDIRDNIKLNTLPVQITGCIDSQKSHLMHSLGEGFLFKVIVTYNDLKAKEIYEDYRLYDKNVFLYPSKDIIFYSADIHGRAIVRDRLEIMRRIIERQSTTIVMSLEGGMDRLLPLQLIKDRVITINYDSVIKLSEFGASLTSLGYERQGQVESPGDFAIRGGIIDIFPLTEDLPYRIELWGDEIDSIRSFDVGSQRSIDQVDHITIYPAAEIIPDEKQMAAGLKKIEEEEKQYVKGLRDKFKTEEAARIRRIIAEFKENLEAYQGSMALESYINYFFDNTMSFYEYFDNKDTIFFLDELGRMSEKGEAVETEFREGMISRIEKGYILPGQIDVIYGYKEVLNILSKKKTLLISTMEPRNSHITPKRKYDFTVQTMASYHKNFDVLVKDLERWKRNKYRVILLSGSRTRAKRLSEDLQEFNLNAFYTQDMNRILQAGEIMVTHGNLRRGFEYPLIKLVIISESDIFGAERKKKKKKVSKDGKKIQSFTELTPGDYIIHENHGLGIYRGIEKIEVDKVTKDYIKIEYGDGGVLYILATGLDVIQKYSGSESRKPKLNKLNSVEWKNTKARVKGAVKEIAKELVELYAKRRENQGYIFGPDTVWQKEFEEAFPYEETDDQLRAIEATKKDMESNKIMDRLICGDVGYGKTEIAIRAAFKAVSDGKQVVFLVPTTILAQQHYNTLVQRMMDYPVSVDMLSRFRSASEQKKTIERLKKGSLDIVVGTHRVLSSDISFKNLGLLIVDEEQRFGVTHKEKIKQLKKEIDVLTLTATPIPRTLHMSLIGIRDMSILDEPPVDRLPIQTYVLEQNEEIIREAISRELARGGQVYYVYNRVAGIDEVASMVSKLVPEANVAVGHGQMNERTLEKIMFDFISGEIDVLVSTTIIETGLDISNVNTMIIDGADRLGLSQLYQLRGRVGRSNRTAYAFLMYRRDKMLKEIAEKRLHAIKEFTELGSGFKIAMRDLEIRGAGNLLGAEQSGHMEAVGYDLYSKMLNEAVRALKGEDFSIDSFETTVDMDIDAFIPPEYIRNEIQKLDIYKRIAGIESEEELMDMQEELLDRYGDLPHAVNNLLNIALIKSICNSVYIQGLTHKGNEVKLVMYPKAKIDVARIPDLIKSYPNILKFYAQPSPNFTYQIPKSSKGKISTIDIFESIKNLLEDFKNLVM